MHAEFWFSITMSAHFNKNESNSSNSQINSKHAKYFGSNGNFGWSYFISVRSEICLKACVQVVYSKTFKEGSKEHDGSGVIVAEIRKPSPVRNHVKCVWARLIQYMYNNNGVKLTTWRILEGKVTPVACGVVSLGHCVYPKRGGQLSSHVHM